MLVKISVENFKSFDDLIELTMISSSKIQEHKDHRAKIKSTSLLKYGVVYGANASGKTNLVDFFGFFKECVRAGIPLYAVDWFCKNKETNKQRPSVFEIQFTINSKFYAYGFSAILSERKMVEEWLYELNQDGSSHCLYSRKGADRPVLGTSVKPLSAEKKKFDVYAEDFEGNASSLFLTEMNRGKKYTPKSKLLFFPEVFNWFRYHLVVILPSTPLMHFEYYYDDKSLQLINQIIKTLDTGISEVHIEEITIEELEKTLPRSIFDDVVKTIHEKIRESAEPHVQVTMRSEDSFFNISVEGEGEPVVSTIKMRHGKSFYDFRFEDESDGTRRIFDLIDIMLNPREDAVYVIDELQRSLHPKLTEHYLRQFMLLHKDKKKQLLFTTHEASIMDQSIFRRDEIWFVERGESNASSIYSLDRFKERYDKKLSKAYLEGRYGAIPVFSMFNYKEGE